MVNAFARYPRILLAIFAGLILQAAAGWADIAVVVEVDADRQFQTMSGWEVTSNLVNPSLTLPSPARHADMFDRLVDEIGINRIRLEIRSGAERPDGPATRFLSGKRSYRYYKKRFYTPVNDNNDPFEIAWQGYDFAELDWHVERAVLPLKERLEARGARLAVNLTFVSFTDKPILHHQPEEYAELMEAVFLHLDRKFGFTPDLIELVLEPDHDKMGGQWTGAQMGSALAATRTRLAKHGYAPGFVVGSTVRASNTVALVRDLAAAADAPEAIREIAYHRYWGAAPPVLNAIAKLANDLAAQTAMLEWWDERATPEVLFRDMTIGQASAWQNGVVDSYYAMDPETGAWIADQRFWVFAPIFRAAPLGATRLHAEATAAEVLPLAFQAEDGKKSVALISGLEDPATITIRGVADPTAPFQLFWTNGRETIHERVQAGQDEQILIRLPGAGTAALLAIPED